MRWRYCPTHGPVPADHKCGRWNRGQSNWAWTETRKQLLAGNPMCTTPGCDKPATEIHHIDDTHVRPVCYAHNPRGPRR